MQVSCTISGIIILGYGDHVKVHIIGTGPDAHTVHTMPVSDDVLCTSDHVVAMVRKAMEMHAYQVLAQQDGLEVV
jgi:hypothetical protein